MDLEEVTALSELIGKLEIDRNKEEILATATEIYNAINLKPKKKYLEVCLLYSCKLNSIPITLFDVSRGANKPFKTIKTQYSRLLKNGLKHSCLIAPANNPFSHIDRIGKALKLSETIIAESRRILKEFLKKRSISGKNPIPYAATTLYLVSKKNHINIIKSEITEKVNLSEPVWRDRIKELSQFIRLNALTSNI